MVDDELTTLLAEQVAYYRARAPEYLDGALHAPGGDELKAALDAFAPRGEVLELACGPGSWTPRLLHYAASVTAVDASPEMLALAHERVGDDDRVRFVCADLFTWRPERRYDVVFFGFWLSHVPLERFAAFWAGRRFRGCSAEHLEKDTEPVRQDFARGSASHPAVRSLRRSPPLTARTITMTDLSHKIAVKANVGQIEDLDWLFAQAPSPSAGSTS